MCVYLQFTSYRAVLFQGSLQIKNGFFSSALGESLTFKIDGETSFGSRMDIVLPSGSEKTFKVNF